MSKFRVSIFYIFISLLLLSSVWGILFRINLTTFLLYFAPAVLFSTYLFRKETIVIPAHIGMLFSLFAITNAVSTIFAVHIQKAFEYQLYYVSVFLIFVFVYNNAEKIKKNIVSYLVLSTGITLLYSLLLNLSFSSFQQFIPTHDEQLVYRHGGLSHQPQGSLVLILLTVLYVSLVHKPRFAVGVGVIILTILLWMSYLRSAYLGFIGVILLHLKLFQKMFTSKVFLIFPVIVIILTTIFFLVPIATDYQIPVVSDFLSTTKNYKYKDFDNGRIDFFGTAVQAIRERPITGYGAGNFRYVSMYFSKNIDTVVGTSHNLFLDIATENGIIAGIIYVAIICLITLKGIILFKRKTDFPSSVLFSLFLALLILFSFNYYHLIPYLYVLFFVSGAIIYKEKTEIKDKYFIPTVSVVIAMIAIVIGAANFLNAQGKPHRALQLYPIYDDAYRSQMRQLYKSAKYDDVVKVHETYSLLFREVPFSSEYLAEYYLFVKDYPKALYYYQTALERSPRDTGYLSRAYETMSLIGEPQMAKEFVENHLRKYPILYPGVYFEDREWFEDWCRDNKINCE